MAHVKLSDAEQVWCQNIIDLISSEEFGGDDGSHQDMWAAVWRELGLNQTDLLIPALAADEIRAFADDLCARAVREPEVWSEVDVTPLKSLVAALEEQHAMV
jgi:hypothetical protein